MPRQKLTPSRRFRLLLPLLVALFAAACTLNNAPDNPQIAISGVPVVQIAAPQPNATYLEGVSVNIQALITNAGADISKVEVAVDGAIVASPEKPNPTDGPAFSINPSWSAAGAGSHTLTVTAYRADGSASAPASVTISVVSSVSLATEVPTVEATEAPASNQSGDNTEADNGDNSDSADVSSDNSDNSSDNNGSSTEKPTDEPKPTETPGKPVATFKQGINVRRGPGTVFEPPIGAFAAGQTADILGVSPDKTWYKVRYYNADGWVFGQLLDIAGDTSSLPVDAGPPTPVPTPVPPTAIPATAVPQTSVNLVAGNIRVDPNPPTCNKTFKINIDIANLGNEDSSVTGSFRIEDSAGGNTETTTGSISTIKKGETIKSADIPITVKTNYNEQHTITITLNPDSTIPETTHDDNVKQFTYKLQKGDC